MEGGAFWHQGAQAATLGQFGTVVAMAQSGGTPAAAAVRRRALQEQQQQAAASRYNNKRPNSTARRGGGFDSGRAAAARRSGPRGLAEALDDLDAFRNQEVQQHRSQHRPWQRQEAAVSWKTKQRVAAVTTSEGTRASTGATHNQRHPSAAVRSVTPLLEVSPRTPDPTYHFDGKTCGSFRGMPDAFPVRRRNLRRPSSRGGVSDDGRPSSSNEYRGRAPSSTRPDSDLFLQSVEWDGPTKLGDPYTEEENCPARRVRPTGRVFVPESTETLRRQALEALQNKYGGVGSSNRWGEARGDTKEGDGHEELFPLRVSQADGTAGEAAKAHMCTSQAPQVELLCDRHRREQHQQQAVDTPASPSRTHNRGFLFCPECFALSTAAAGPGGSSLSRRPRSGSSSRRAEWVAVD